MNTEFASTRQGKISELMRDVLQDSNDTPQLTFFGRIERAVNRRIVERWLRYKGVTWTGRSPWISILRRPVLDIKGMMVCGDNCRIFSHPKRTYISVAEGAELILGDRVGINHDVTISVTRKVALGSYSRCAEGVRIVDSNYHEVSEKSGVKVKPVIVGRNVWLCQGVRLSAGVTIGDHSVISLGSVVIGKIKERTIAIGNPARSVAKIKCSDDWFREK